MPISEIYNVDCLGYMRSLPDKHFDLCIADPPYSIERFKRPSRQTDKMQIHKEKYKNGISWDNVPTQEFFDEIFRVSKHCIIWGGEQFSIAKE